jgi:hypothetical protein
MLRKLTNTNRAKKKAMLMERTAMVICDTDCMWRCVQLMDLDFDNYVFLYADF